MTNVSRLREYEETKLIGMKEKQMGLEISKDK
ncbi:hypothetical protein F441_22657 [Phytophthora nicotianae CJ01A1]|uniref:Uncharacterized protein n=6 Tax=Phytophthora nicotianae TaxID=4792 RepID=W2QMG1_PHYN3|nr:hypothetical protein PPTG_22109 [Phytophthora nicotianae INRA-310]ETI54425.1 hypothetical protein F443_02747 [Phytophthora nicotianae P1569]ETK94264.1 hypothetical protein L915_02640 [Phytophthora nicotianae]ETO83174.1 hypothetical protein F444_02752 [Phytophthora nicotianae P1976]ETO99919.1 hypothetical protein F441_22657 [Phytophthora nicotianae CJ01A1]ETP52227.1 hypothetical protein F442_02722 [Phytophthora nicotianae P10297]